jgi:hypothetical protein
MNECPQITLFTDRQAKMNLNLYKKTQGKIGNSMNLLNCITLAENVSLFVAKGLFVPVL